jgi:hypothetical protein
MDRESALPGSSISDVSIEKCNSSRNEDAVQSDETATLLNLVVQACEDAPTSCLF